MKRSGIGERSESGGVPPASETPPKAAGHRTQDTTHTNPEPITRHASHVTPKARGQRILIHAPPQFGKSIIVSKRFPAWALGIDPKLRIVLAGYNLDHAAGFAEVVRDTMAGQIFRDLFPQREVQIQKSASRERFSTQARRKLKDGQDSITAVGLLSGFTGKGADILIIDDPYASPDDARSDAINERVWRWWNELAKVRIDDKSNVLVMFHRYHEDDFAGRLIAQGGWEYYRFPAIADEEPWVWSVSDFPDERYSATSGRSLSRSIGDRSAAEAVILPAPVPSGSEVEESRGRSPSQQPQARIAPPNFPPQAEQIQSTWATTNSETEVSPPAGSRHETQDTGHPNAEAHPAIASEEPSETTRHPSLVTRHAEGNDPTGRRPGDLLSPMRSRTYLKGIEDHDPMVWLGQFQGRPRAPEGAFIKREWIKEIAPQEIPPLALWVRFWDLATKADQKGDFYSGALVGVGPDQTVYIRDITRFRQEWPDARDIIAETTRRDALEFGQTRARYEVGVEQVAWMRSMIQDLFTLPIFRQVSLTTVRPDGDKKERASAWVAKAKNDMLRISKDHWNSDFIQECLAFDGLGHSHDDQIDSVSGAYSLLWNLKGQLIEEDLPPAPGSLQFYRELNEWYRQQNGDYDSGWSY